MNRYGPVPLHMFGFDGLPIDDIAYISYCGAMDDVTDESEAESVPLLGNSRQTSVYPQDHYVDDAEFTELVRQAEQAILRYRFPRRIEKGSSGSYFVTNLGDVGILVDFIILILCGNLYVHFNIAIFWLLGLFGELHWFSKVLVQLFLHTSVYIISQLFRQYFNYKKPLYIVIAYNTPISAR